MSKSDSLIKSREAPRSYETHFFGAIVGAALDPSPEGAQCEGGFFVIARGRLCGRFACRTVCSVTYAL